MQINLNKEDFVTFLALVWSSWHERNKFVHGGRLKEPKFIEDVGLWLSSCQQAQSSSSSSQTLPQSTDKKWRAPNEGCLKMNVDASVVAGMDKIGPGAVIRDSQGFVMGAMSKSVSGIFSPFLAECMAIREGLQFAWESGLKVSSVESDAAQAVHSVNNPAVLAPVDPVIEDILALVTVAGGGSCCAISRVVNGTSHTLAHHALALDTWRFWLKDESYLS